jgi:Na+-transporting NADH:ubiquinone oxidoreductase subunit C
VIFMAAVAAVFTGAVSAVNLVSRERIRLNQELARKRVVMRVAGMEVPPEAPLAEVAALYEKCVEDTGLQVKAEGEGAPVLFARNEGGEALGYVFRVAGRGFWDRIEGYMAVSPGLDRVLGLAFYRQSETPGLGAEITKPWFEAQFEGKELPEELPAEGPIIELVGADEGKGPYDVDAVTGATGTCEAVERFLNADLRAFLLLMRDRPPPAAREGGGDG